MTSPMRYALAAVALLLAGPAQAESYAEIGWYGCPVLRETFGTPRYDVIIDPVVGYINRNTVAAERLGNACIIAERVRRECLHRPARNIGETADSLIVRALRNERLPKLPHCGA